MEIGLFLKELKTQKIINKKYDLNKRLLKTKGSLFNFYKSYIFYLWQLKFHNEIALKTSLLANNNKKKRFHVFSKNN